MHRTSLQILITRMQLVTEPYLELVSRMPKSCYHIVAQFDKQSIGLPRARIFPNLCDSNAKILSLTVLNYSHRLETGYPVVDVNTSSKLGLSEKNA